MTAQEVNQEILDKVVPRLHELGVEAFVLSGYVKTVDAKGNEKIERIVLVDGAKNVPMQDGLRPLVVHSLAWGQIQQ